MPIFKGAGPELRLLIAASEVVGFAKTGGLADVAGALPSALAHRGHECAVILPMYHCARLGRVPLQPTQHVLRAPVGGRSVEGRLWRGTIPGSEVPAYLVEQNELFDRDDPTLGRGLYQFLRSNGTRGDYPDNDARFIFFCRAILEAVRLLDFWPDVLHINDWQTGLVPVYLREEYRPLSENWNAGLGGPRPYYDRIRTLLTIHNIAFQGASCHWDMLVAGLACGL